jgi:general secretion pathway protein G
MTARCRGFTLIELLVVLAILALLLTIATPRYIHQVEHARETTLRSTLKVMRESIDKFYGDQGRYPASLDELVDRNYLKSVPIDPMTEKRDTWVVMTEEEVRAAAPASSTTVPGAPSGGNGGSGAPRSPPGVADVHSGAPGNGDDGTPYSDW